MKQFLNPDLLMVLDLNPKQKNGSVPKYIKDTKTYFSIHSISVGSKVTNNHYKLKPPR